MNKKSIRSRTSKPVEKTLSAAVHAAAMALDGDTPGAPSTPLAADGAPHDMPVSTETDAGDLPVAQPAADVAAPAPAPARPRKPGKPVKLSLTLPADEAQLFDELRQVLHVDGVKLKKSVLLRAALVSLADMEPERLTQIVTGLETAKPTEKKPRKAKSKK